ncbi:MAG: hypothetical protein ACREJC_17890, partial [Tepidisphaeraceae bacterium]
LLIVALLATGITRQMASSRRAQGLPLGSGDSTSQFSRMNSFALALLLGGLRGPLVMVLWTSSESKKSEKNLEDVDTQIEWIRMLQPEFDTVHIFQIWNKAYNHSVQMAGLSNKYLTILDALDYAHKVDLERPNNINIIYQIGSVYGDKLADSTEKQYYRKRIREESLPHLPRQKLKPNDPGYRRLDLDPLLDQQANILPRYLIPGGSILTDPNDPAQRYDGSELPFLTKYQPFPYGVSAHALAFNYRKRAQLLARLGGQKHAQLADLVIDSRPALDLKQWAEDEMERGRVAELQAFGKAIPTERIAMEEPTERTPLNQTVDQSKRTLLEKAIYSYDMSARLAADADHEYNEHLQRFQNNIQLYESHKDALAALGALAAADRDYLRAMLAPADQRQPILDAARREYEKAVWLNELMILKYYINDPTVVATCYPPGVTRENVSDPRKLPPDQYAAVLRKAVPMFRQSPDAPGNIDNVNEYLTYTNRANARLKSLPE